MAERDVRVKVEFAPPATVPHDPGRVSAWRLDALPPARSQPLAPPHVSLGRALDNDVVLDDPRVSRYHAELRYAVDGWSVHDLGSTNGTYVNGTQVTACVLQAGDRLRVGDREFVLAVGGSAA
jgi:predicted component of type VI protein secretion system